MAKRGRNSSQEDDSDERFSHKQNRNQRACDNCRKKKSRCFGYQPGGKGCHPCESIQAKCTFSQAEKRVDPLTSRVQGLEDRLKQAEKLLVQVTAINANAHHTEHMERVKDHQTTNNRTIVRLPRIEKGAEYKLLSEDGRGSHGDDEVSDEEKICSNKEESVSFVRLDTPNDNEQDHHDKSSKTRTRPSKKRDNEKAPLHFFGGASDLKIFPQINQLLGISGEELTTHLSQSTTLQRSATPKYDTPPNQIPYEWPSLAMQDLLIDIFFAHFNQHYPIINEVLFRRSKAESNDWITQSSREVSMLALGILSTACRYLSLEDIKKDPNLPQEGRHWSNLLHDMLEHTTSPINVSAVHIQALLLSIYCQIANHDSANTYWLNLAKCVRLLQSMGAHRKFSAKANGFSLANKELYCRLWWMTYMLDRMMSAHMGRPMCINDEDVDADEILLVDDEYLVAASESGTEPIQPIGKVCSLSGFHQSVRLSKIIGVILRSIYGPTKEDLEEKNQKEKKVDEIDNALRRWLEEIPNHLVYSVDQPNTDWLLQSSRIFLLYYYAQTLLHRPFVQIQQTNELSFTLNAMNIVSNASRGGIHIVHHAAKRNLANLLGVETQLRTLTFSVFLLLISLNALGKEGKVPYGVIADIRKGISSLRSVEQHWETAKLHADHLTCLLQKLLHIVPVTTSHNSKRGASESEIVHRGQVHQGEGSNATINRPFDDPTTGVALPFKTSELQDYFHLFPQISSAQEESFNQYGNESALTATTQWPIDGVAIQESVDNTDTSSNVMTSSSMPIKSRQNVPTQVNQQTNASTSWQDHLNTFDPLDALSTLDHIFSDADWTQPLFQT